MQNHKVLTCKTRKAEPTSDLPSKCAKNATVPSMLLLYCYFVPERRLSAVGQEMPEKLEEKARSMTLFSDTRTQSQAVRTDCLTGFDLKTSSLFYEPSELVSHYAILLLLRNTVPHNACLTHWLRQKIEKGS